MKITTGLLTTTIDSIKLQATTLAQLTASTNELTQSAIVKSRKFSFLRKSNSFSLL